MNIRYLCLAVPLLLGLACAPPSMMVKKQAPASLATFQPEPGKAALVISRTTNFGGAIAFKTYIDKKFIGATRGKCFFAKTDVEPGMKFVSSWGENGVAVKVPFEAGKVYFLQQNVSIGVLRARVVMEAVNAKRLDAGDLKNVDYYQLDPALNGEPDLTDEQFKDVIQGADTLFVKDDGTAELVPEKKS